MPTAVNVAKQCLTTESSYVLEEAVNVARRRGHSQTTSLHAVSALLSLPTSPLRDACARVRNSAYSPRLQFKALDLCLSVSLDRIQSGHQQQQPGSDDPPVSNSLMAAIKRSQAHQRRLPESFRLYQEMSQSNQNSLSCVKVELRQLVLSILDDPVVSRVFGEAGFRSSELKLSIIRPIPHLFRYSSPRGQQQPLFLCNGTGNHTEPELNPVRWGFSVPNRDITGDSSDHRRINDVFTREKERNPLLVGVSAYSVLTDYLNSLENRSDGLIAVNIGSEVSDQIKVKFNKTFTDARFNDLRKVAEQGSGPGLVVNYGDLRVFTDGEGDVSAASYIVSKVSELLRRCGKRVWLIGATASNDVYEKMVRKFPNVEKDWDLQLLTITTTLRSCSPHHKSSLMGSFVPFGGFFSTPDLKLPFSGYNKEITKPVSSISDQTQSTLPPWLQMTTIIDSNQKSDSKTKEGLESVFGNKSPSSASASTGSAKSVTTDLNLRMSPVTTGFGLKTRSVSSSCLDNPRDLNAESFKIIYHRLTNRVSGQDEAARVISCALSQPPKTSTRRDVWLNLVGSDTVGKRRMSLVLAEIVYQSEHRFMPVDLDVAEHGINGCDDVMGLRGRTMVDHIFEVLCRNPFCVVFLENIDKADEKLQVSLSKAIETGKFMDSHGREVGIGNTTFVMTSSSVEDSGTRTTYSEEKLLRVKGRQVAILIETVFCLNSEKKRKLGLRDTVEKGKRLNRTANGVLDLNLPAQETETDTEENSKLWLVNLKKHDSLIEVPFKPFDFEELAERIKKSLKEIFAKCVRSDCLLEIDLKIMERLLAAVYFSNSREDIIEEMMEKVMARVFLHVKERNPNHFFYSFSKPCKAISSSLEKMCRSKSNLCSSRTTLTEADLTRTKLEGVDATMSLLEHAACDDLASFKRQTEENSLDINKPGFWYCKRVGSKKMGYQERTPLMVAAMYGSIEVLTYIISTGKSDMNRVSSDEEKITALHCAVSACSVSIVKVIKILLDASASPNCLDANGNKPVDLLVRASRFIPNQTRKAVEFLLTGISLEEEEVKSVVSKYPADASLPDINEGVYGTDEFRMFSFKVKPCSRAYSHDWTECPFVHPGENARRRDPRKYPYTCVPCPEFRKGSCPKGDSCEYAHGVFESWLHPAQYKTRLCKDETCCARKVCFFAHRRDELRAVNASTGSAMVSPRSSNQSPEMSPRNGGLWQNRVDSLTPPPLQLNGSRLKSSLSARDMGMELGFRGSFDSSSVMQVQSPRRNQYPSSPVRQPPSHGFESSAAMAAAVMNARSSAFARRSLSFKPAPVASLNVSEWGSPNGKLEWGMQREEMNKMRRSASFGINGDNNNYSNNNVSCPVRDYSDEPDVSWVNSLVKESAPERNTFKLPFWGEQMYIDHEKQQIVA
ncbi:unnamed protein product [Eruca vesicaria subsp. sativa]|uniref:Uncharacterized protein n=1 Tax=Eruca vesicaria subsp. sativa TaxID=29727 RepID=A0ABC8J4F9_ERUVS|nr:unnamed protein product [Eruca vesicaria subsp. sativa]